MARIVIIGGSGAGLLPVALATTAPTSNRWGSPSAALTRWADSRHEVWFLPRHGVAGVIAPHAVNYRANMQLIADTDPDWVIALNAVGGISEPAAAGRLVIPDQLVDYSWGRAHSYFGEASEELKFIDFTEPYSRLLRQYLVGAASRAGIECLPTGTYGVTQGPRLETAAEIDRMERDGCHIVGMTAMPEAALARELGLEYASVSFVVNRAAGRATSDLHAEIEQYMAQGITQTERVLAEFMRGL